jgi:two-component system chemotaxis sensor kinase CheA
MEIDLEAIVKTYLAECEERLANMEEALVALEADPRADRYLEAVFRSAHTIKGNSASLGFPKVAGFAHVIEDLLQRFRNHSLAVTHDRVTLLLRSVDALRQMIPDAVSGTEELRPDQVELLTHLADGNPGPIERSPAPPSSSTETHQLDTPVNRLNETDSVLAQASSIRVDTEKLNRMLNLAGEIAIAQGRLRQTLEVRGHSAAEVLESHGQVERLTLELQEQIMRVRMVPLGPTFRQFLRVVRDIAQGEGKLVRLETHGDDVEVDMSVVEHLKDPLTHMIRNALDHGIETPDQRRAGGKNPCAVLTLSAHHEGGNIVIEVGDDGAGLNLERIGDRARALGIMAESEKYTDEELSRLIFMPGFSTASEVTDLSGRGVGMDVVKRNIEALRGSIGVTSRPGNGTSFRIKLPLTLAIIEGFGVGVGEDTYVLPLHAVIECTEMPGEEQKGHELGVINLRGEPLPYMRLRSWFDLPTPRPKRENVVVVEVDGVRAGIAVDALYGARQTVIKPLGKHFRDIAGIAGSAILGNGRVALILDVPRLIREVIRSRSDDNARTKEPHRWGENRANHSNAGAVPRNEAL